MSDEYSYDPYEGGSSDPGYSYDPEAGGGSSEQNASYDPNGATPTESVPDGWVVPDWLGDAAETAADWALGKGAMALAGEGLGLLGGMVTMDSDETPSQREARIEGEDAAESAAALDAQRSAAMAENLTFHPHMDAPAEPEPEAFGPSTDGGYSSAEEPNSTADPRNYSE